MKVWILFIIMNSSINTIEFNSEENCEQAKNVVDINIKMFYRVDMATSCLPITK